MSENRNEGRLVSRREILLAAGVASIATVFPRELLAAPSDTLSPFLGSFRHAGGDKEREARDKAIDAVVDEMNIFVRGIARDKLKSSNAIPAALKISADASALTIALDNRVYTAPLDGRSVKVTGITGDKLDLRYRVTEGRIEQNFKGDERGRVNTYSIEGDKVVMQVRIYASQLPKDVKYKLTYKRA
ncbi:MAG: hypothetical protein HUU21_30895 [Polyangiaceae bacterium]|nr:hypothetical protein [Polyangiaceae bacterium]